MNWFKKLAVVCFLVWCHLVSIGQTDSTQARPTKSPFAERLVYNGNVGLSLGDITVVNLSPGVGYKVTENFVAGIGGTYLYYNDRTFQFRTSVYGGRLYGQYLINSFLFGYGEYEVLNGQFDYFNPGERINVVSPMIGGGVYQRMGGSAGYYMMVLWNLNDSRYSPNGRNPIFRAGFAVGL